MTERRRKGVPPRPLHRPQELTTIAEKQMRRATICPTRRLAAISKRQAGRQTLPIPETFCGSDRPAGTSHASLSGSTRDAALPNSADGIRRAANGGRAARAARCPWTPLMTWWTPLATIEPGNVQVDRTVALPTPNR